MCTETTTGGSNQCGVRDEDQNRERECPDGQVCVLEHTLNVCVQSKFPEIIKAFFSEKTACPS